MEDTSDKIYVKAGNAKHEKALDALFSKYNVLMRSICSKILRDEGLVEDALQEIRLKIWQSIENWDRQKEAKFSTWLYKVALHTAIDFKRKQKHHMSLDMIDAVLYNDQSDKHLYHKQLSRKVDQLLREIPVQQSLALKYYYNYGESIKDIEKKMDKSEQSVRSLLKRGRSNLKDLINNTDINPLY